MLDSNAFSQERKGQDTAAAGERGKTQQCYYHLHAQLHVANFGVLSASVCCRPWLVVWYGMVWYGMQHSFGRSPTSQLWPGSADMLTNGYLVPDLCLLLIYSNVLHQAHVSPNWQFVALWFRRCLALVQTLVVCCPVRTPAQLQHSCFVCCYYSRLTVPRCRAADMC